MQHKIRKIQNIYIYIVHIYIIYIYIYIYIYTYIYIHIHCTHVDIKNITETTLLWSCCIYIYIKLISQLPIFEHGQVKQYHGTYNCFKCVCMRVYIHI